MQHFRLPDIQSETIPNITYSKDAALQYLQGPLFENLDFWNHLCGQYGKHVKTLWMNSGVLMVIFFFFFYLWVHSPGRSQRILFHFF